MKAPPPLRWVSRDGTSPEARAARLFDAARSAPEPSIGPALERVVSSRALPTRRLRPAAAAVCLLLVGPLAFAAAHPERTKRMLRVVTETIWLAPTRLVRAVRPARVERPVPAVEQPVPSDAPRPSMVFEPIDLVEAEPPVSPGNGEQTPAQRQTGASEEATAVLRAAAPPSLAEDPEWIAAFEEGPQPGTPEAELELGEQRIDSGDYRQALVHLDAAFARGGGATRERALLRRATCHALNADRISMHADLDLYLDLFPEGLFMEQALRMHPKH
jgi:hypothetical protein